MKPRCNSCIPYVTMHRVLQTHDGTGRQSAKGLANVVAGTGTQANKQTSKPANKQRRKQANTQTSKQINKQTHKQSNTHKPRGPAARVRRNGAIAMSRAAPQPTKRPLVTAHQPHRRRPSAVPIAELTKGFGEWMGRRTKGRAHDALSLRRCLSRSLDVWLNLHR
jgi:hypothetical protein